MQELALYRKYRPKKWSDVLGQDHIVKILEGAVKLKRISHAYLFTGSKGTGKTSIARILAEEVGCLPEDLYEIDAASNRGIDDIREIKESVTAAPFRSPFKVYIVDEVHMLTKEAFNALLKTLEEPPSYVIFILATTEPEKLPDTVISRCQVFDFKKPSQLVLRDMILKVAKKEGYSLDVSTADLIAMFSEGSFRDAQGILQKILSFSEDKKISKEEAEMVIAAPKGQLVNDFIRAWSEKDLEKGILALNQTVEKNLDTKVFLKLVLQKMRFALLLRLKAGMEEEIKKESSPEDFKFLEELAVSKESNINSASLLELLTVYEDIQHSYIPQLPLELALAKLAKK